MLPALSPTQTVSGSDGRRSASPDSRIQWHRYRASPPFTSRTSVSRTQGTQRSSSMLGSAVSSSTPRDFQPSSLMGVGHLPADELPGPAGTAPGVPVPRGRDAEGAGLGDRLAQQVDQRVVDARVLDAGGSEKKFHAAPFGRPVSACRRPGRGKLIGARIASVPEARLEDFGSGLTPVTEGWFVVNVRDAEWWSSDGRGARCAFENEYGDPPVEFGQLGINVTVLEPGQTGLYHAEENQEAFLVVAGECALVVEHEERRLRRWDFFHAPPWTEHAFVGAGEGPCVILMAGARSARACATRCRSSRRATARASRRRRPTGGRRTRRPSASGASGRRTGLVCPGRSSLRRPSLTAPAGCRDSEARPRRGFDGVKCQASCSPFHKHPAVSRPVRAGPCGAQPW